MKIMTFNIRGLGGLMKRKEIKKMIQSEKIEFVCIQETKKDVVDKKLVGSMWSHENFDWIYAGANGMSGGLPSMWNTEVFVKESLWGDEGALGVRGRWKGEEVEIVNVYAPCVNSSREELWETITKRIEEKERKWCVCGDFNAIRSEEERRGKGRKGDRRRMVAFNEFIAQTELHDLPLTRRKFTWYRDHGISCSRLDRFLFSESWLKK